mgnify:FL=1
MLFEFQFESELAFISEIRSKFLEVVLQLTFACALEVGEILVCLRQDHVGRYGGPNSFSVSKNHALNHFLVSENVIFGVREEHC